MLDDGNEIPLRRRIPVHQLLVAPVRVAVRGGLWSTPITASASRACSEDTCSTRLRQRVHYTFGGGIVFEKFQFDVGFDRSETVKTFSVSAVLRF